MEVVGWKIWAANRFFFGNSGWKFNPEIPVLYIPHLIFCVPPLILCVPHLIFYVPHLIFHVPPPIFYVNLTCDAVDTRLEWPLPPGVVKIVELSRPSL